MFISSICCLIEMAQLSQTFNPSAEEPPGTESDLADLTRRVEKLEDEVMNQPSETERAVEKLQEEIKS